MLQLENAGVTGAGCWMVRGVTLDLTPGALTALVGPNGSGKTTTLRMLAGLIAPSEGVVRFENRDLRDLSPRELARRVTYVPQDTHLDFEFTVREIVAMGRHAHLGRFQGEGTHDREIIQKAMERTDILHLANRAVTELSGGERQRVVIARSLATEAGVVLLDEPTASLDIAHALDILALCRSLAAEGKTICLAIHDLNAAARFADRVGLMAGGNLVAHGPSGEMFTPERIATVFGVDVQTAVTPDGARHYVFRRRNGQAAPERTA